MAEYSFPFGSVSGDRKYKSQDFRRYFAQFISNGVFYASANALKVSEAGGMSVTLAAGGAWVDGAGYLNDSAKALTLDTADGSLSRIDRVVIRCDYVERQIYADILKGSYSAQPQAAALTRNADIYELGIADILVAGGVVSISQSAITDTRLNTSLCGIVTGLIEQADTTEIFNQFEVYFEEFKRQYIAEMENWTDTEESAMIAWQEAQKSAFLTWVESIKDILDETVAGKLQNEIEAEAEAAFKRHYGLVQQTTEFKADGSIVVTNDEGILTVTKGTDEDGNKMITETLETTGIETYVKTTRFIPATSTTNKIIREGYSVL